MEGQRLAVGLRHDGRDPRFLGLALDPMRSSSTTVKRLRSEFGGQLAEQDPHVVVLGLAFEPRREIDRVAERGIVEAVLGAHVADDAVAGVDADADR